MDFSFENIVSKASQAVTKGAEFATGKIQQFGNFMENADERFEVKADINTKKNEFDKNALDFLTDLLDLDSAPEGFSDEFKSKFYALKAQIKEIQVKEEDYASLKGYVICKNCGAEIKKNFFRCPECNQLNEYVNIEDIFKDSKGEPIPRDIYLKDGSVLKNVSLKRVSSDKRNYTFENVMGIYGLEKGDIVDIK